MYSILIIYDRKQTGETLLPIAVIFARYLWYAFFMDTLYIVMPAYNEAANISRTIGKWHPLLELGSEDSRLVIFNDGSRDDTLAVCRSLVAAYPRLTVIDKPNSGHGPTCLTAYAYALEHGADYIFQTDSDDQTEPDEMRALWAARHDYDIQIGLRKNRRDGFSRIIVSKVLKGVLLLIFKVRIPDANTPFRLISRPALQNYLALIPPNFFLANVLMSALAVRRNDQIRWQPITFRPRTAGVNSINLKKIFRIGLRALSDLSAAEKATRNVGKGGNWDGSD